MVPALALVHVAGVGHDPDGCFAVPVGVVLFVDDRRSQARVRGARDDSDRVTPFSGRDFPYGRGLT